jgi:hypothetical protein
VKLGENDENLIEKKNGRHIGNFQSNSSENFLSQILSKMDDLVVNFV